MANQENTRTSLWSRSTHGFYTVEDMGNSTGYRFFVDSGSANASDTDGGGASPDIPFATLAYAFSSNRVTADQGDIIYVMPGHTESVTAADDIMMDIAGVTIIGIGGIGDRPVITFTTIDSADIEIDAANITIKNISFRCNIASLIAAIDVDAAHFHIKDCSFIGTDAADEAFLIAIITDTNANDIIIESCDFNFKRTEDGTAVTTTSTEAIRLVGADRAIVKDNYINGDFTTSAINSVATLSLDIQILGNKIENIATENITGCIDVHTNTTGFLHGNVCYAADPTSADDIIDDGSMINGLNWVSNTIGATPVLWGTAGAAGIEAKIDVLDEYFDVPAADSDSNAQGFEVLGNKTDTVRTGAVDTTSSAIRYLKQLVTDVITIDGIVDTIDLYHDVPAADSDSNVQGFEVLGNKTDTTRTGAVGTTASAMRYLKQLVTELQVLDGYQDIPAADSDSNAQGFEVLGNKEDAVRTGAVGTTASAIRYLKQLVTELQVLDGYQDIPAADSDSNAQGFEVLGNKEDAVRTGAVGTTASAIRYLKQLVTELQVVDEFFDVPAADSTSNAQGFEVVGNKDDAQPRGVATTSDSAQGYLKQLVNTSDVLHYDAANYLAVTADFTSATWNVTTSSHEIATITGIARVRILPEVSGNLTDGDNTCLIRLGTETTDNAFIADTTATTLGDGELWTSSTITSNIKYLAPSGMQDYIVSGDDIGYVLDTTALTGGSIIFHIWWEALDATGNVAAGVGGTL